MIKLGSRVKDLITGREGLLTSRTFRKNGMVRVGIEIPVEKGDEVSKVWEVDEALIEVVDPGLSHLSKTPLTYDIPLGGQVKDKISGFKGVAVSYTVMINGCVFYTIAPEKVDKEGKIVANEFISADDIELLKNPKVPATKPSVEVPGALSSFVTHKIR